LHILLLKVRTELLKIIKSQCHLLRVTVESTIQVVLVVIANSYLA
jgi:hypothetical protein